MRINRNKHIEARGVRSRVRYLVVLVRRDASCTKQVPVVSWYFITIKNNTCFKTAHSLKMKLCKVKNQRNNFEKFTIAA